MRAFKICAAFCAAFAAITCSAEVLVKELLRGKAEGSTPAGEGVSVWRGPQGEAWGEITVENDSKTDEGKAILFKDENLEPNKAPVLTVKWQSEGRRLVVKWQYVVLAEDPFLSVSFLGAQDWRRAGLALILENGNVFVQYGDAETRKKVGEYKVGKAGKVQVELDVKERTFELSLDGRKVAAGLPWQTESEAGMNSLAISANLAGGGDADKSSVLKVSDVKVE